MWPCPWDKEGLYPLGRASFSHYFKLTLTRGESTNVKDASIQPIPVATLLSLTAFTGKNLAQPLCALALCYSVDADACFSIN